MWLSTTRPDITYATKELARGMSTPTQEHLANLKHLLRYLVGTRDYALMLKPSTTLPKPDEQQVPLELHTYCDSDWAGCKTTRRSTTGTVTQLLGCTVHHCSRTQATVALSSTESEAYAIGTGTSETLYLEQLLTETLMFSTIHMFTHTDSTGATAVVNRTGLSPKTKHMQLRYLWLQELYTTRKLKLRKVGTLDNLGDVLTKHVTPQVLTRLLGRLGLINVLDTYVSMIYVTSEESNLDFEVTSGNLDLTSFEDTFAEVTSAVTSSDFSQPFSTPPTSAHFEHSAMALVTVVATERVLATATGSNDLSKGKYHANWSCVGLQSRKTPLVEIPLGLAVQKGLTACNFCDTVLHNGTYSAPLGTPPPDSRPAATSRTSSTGGGPLRTEPPPPQTTSAGTSELTLCEPGLEDFLDLGTNCEIEKNFNLGLRTFRDVATFETAKNFESNCLSDKYYFVALPRENWETYRNWRSTLPNVLLEETAERGNETLCFTAWGALRYYFFRLEQTANLPEHLKTAPPLLVGLKVDTNEFFRNWTSDNFTWGRFNRWYSDYFLTIYTTGLKLTPSMLQSALELEPHFSYVSYLAATSEYYRFKQLLWDGRSPAPHWLPAAQGNFGTAGTSSDDSEELPVTRKKTSKATSSNEDSNTVQLALATALLVLTKK